ncbi:MAG: chemotaxis protein CheW [Phycisphaerae bacterium]
MSTLLGQQADVGDTLDDGTSAQQIVSFCLGDEEYGVNIMNVQEVILVGKITPLPRVPSHICGLINLRGHVIPIIDLRKKFELPPTEPSEHSRIIILNVIGKTMGVTVDAVHEVLRVNQTDIEPPPEALLGSAEEYLQGLVRFDSKLLVLLDIQKIVEAESDVVSNGKWNA